MGGDKELLIQPMTPFEEEMALENMRLRRQLETIKNILEGSDETLTSDSNVSDDRL